MGNSRSTTKPLNYRVTLLVTGLAVAATGLLVNAVVSGTTGDFLGGALYAVLACVVVAFVAPRQHPLVVGAIGFAFCALIEVFQLTGVPLAIADVFAPAALVLGTTFVPLDLVAYVVGAVGAVAGLLLSRADRAARAARAANAAR